MSQKSGHEVRFEISRNGFGVQVKLLCHEPADAGCRTYCPNVECEEFCLEPESHPRKRVDYCNVREWMESDGVADCYEGEPTSVRDGAVEVFWADVVGEGFRWAYASEVKP